MRKLVIVALVMSAVGVVPTRSFAATNPPLPEDAIVSVPGHGWGHGRGMGQWGAKGMADAGKTWSAIVTHYYSGTTIGSRTGENIRVLVERSPDVVVTSDAAFTAAWSDGSKAATSTDTYKFLRARYDGTNYRVEKASAWTGPWSTVGAKAMPVVFNAGSSMLQLVFNSGSVHYYRGRLIARYTSSDNMRTINDVSMDGYLFGVVPRESPASWPAEALKAQAVAARTYATYQRDGARASGRMYDICATTACQVYAGYAMKTSPSATKTVLEYASTNSAVTATSGKVVLYGGKPILAEFSSSTGGYTAPGNVTYQKAVPDAGDVASPYHNWKGTLRVSDIEARWPAVGRLIDVKVTKRNGFGDWGGRVLEMTLTGTSGSVTIGGYDFRHAFEWPARTNGVRSVWFNTLYWRAAVASVPTTVSIVQGETKTITALVKNTGTAPWGVGGKVRVATSSASRFASPSWLSSTRAAEIARNATDPTKTLVYPGQVAEFKIPLATDTVAPGSYTQAFKMVADDTSVMAATFSVTVEVLVPWIEDAPNLLRNGSFEASNLLWGAKNFVSADGPSVTWARHGERSIHITGGGTKSVQQTVTFTGGSARRFTLGGWNRAAGTSTGGGPIELSATATYTDSTTQVWHVPFARGPHLWTYDESAFTTSATKSLASVSTAAVFVDQTGDTYFDALRLIESPIANASFEDGLTGWTGSALDSSDGPSGADKRDGGRALALKGTGSKSVSQPLAIAGRKGDRFVLSAWNRSVGSDPTGGAIGVAVTLHNTDGTTTATPVTFATDAHDWTLREAEVKAAKAFDRATIKVARASQTGTQYFDDIQLARTYTSNKSFEQDLGSWTTRGFGADDAVSTKSFRDGARSLRMAGSGAQVAFQSLALIGSAGHRFVVGGWSAASGTDANGGLVGVRVILRNTDGTSTSVPTSFGSAPHQWSYTERAFSAPKAYSRVDVYVVFAEQTGGAYFDGITLRNA